VFKLIPERRCFLADIQVFFLHQYIDSSDITKEAPSKGVQIFRNGRPLVMRDEWYSQQFVKSDGTCKT
jgi:hypothetical protein